MCTQTTFELLQESIDKFIAQDRLFTAFDVTVFAKGLASERGLSISERHKELKNDIHDIVDRYVGSIYEKQLWDVGAPTKAFLYYPVGIDPNSYQPLDRNKLVTTNKVATTYITSNPNNTVVPTLVPDTDDGDGTDHGRKPDHRGSLTVPSYLLKSVGLKSGDKASVTQDNDTLVIKKDVVSNLLTLYTVDHSNNVRITKSILEKIGNSAGYDFELDGDKVLIKKA